MESDERVHQRHNTSYRFLLSSKKLFVELLCSFVLQDFKRKEADLENHIP
ncbi:hypothetical protein [Paenibacillus medicaginis]|uniref:Uncharacterized protein n=1 Tax=Paenibacillus medicaginis TaxID=1470560 RepID=A0ABV5BZ18_9BACL